MLEVLFRDVPQDTPHDCVRDVEAFFDETDFEITPLVSKIVQLIEKGTILDCFSFLDRFGYKQNIENMSTGCKAALSVLRSDQWIDLVECNRKARNVIFSLCSGHVVVDTPSSSLVDYSDGKRLDICVEGHIFHTIDELNEYINWGRLMDACSR